MIKLVVKAQLTEGGTKDYSYEFDQPLITIGRLKENDIQLPLSTVSGYHAQIVKENDNYYLIDRGSINGSYLNGQRLVGGEKKLLGDNDLIKIQTFDLYFSTGINVIGIDSGATVQVARQMVMEVLGSWQTSTAEKPRVILMGGPENGKQFELNEGTNLVAGRTSGVEIVIEHPSVSRRHAEISLSWSGAFIKDLNSANGTFINDERISGSRRLRDRDEIRFGQQSSSAPVILIFSNPAEALLSKLEDMQMTDSTPGRLQSKEVTDAAEKEGQKLAEDAAVAEQAEGAEEGAEAEAAKPEEAEESVPAAEEKEEIQSPQQEVRRVFSSPLGIIGGLVLAVSVLGLIVFFIWGKGSLTPPSASPEKGSTGDLIHVQGSFDPEDVKGVKILERDAYVLKRDKDGLQIKLPDFPNLSGAETDTEILVMGEKDVLSRINFKVLIAPRIQNMNPLSGGIGSEVRIQTNMPGQATSVLFGSDIAGTRVDGQDIIATVPSPAEKVPENGLKVPITVRINNMQARNSMDFIILPKGPEPVQPQEVFRLSFVAKPYPTPLGFNEYSIDTNIGPLLILVAKDDAASSRERAEMVAKNLNNAITYFQSNPDAQVSISNQENSYSLFADGAVDGTKSPLLRVLSEDTIPYSKINQRGVALEELAKWWQMLLGSYYRTFVQTKSPEDTGIIASGGLVFQQIVNFYATGNDQAGRYYAVDFLNTLPVDQKSKLLSLSFGLPAKVAKVEGTWSGIMENKLYSNIRESTLDLDLKLRQQGNSLSGTATIIWKMDLGGSGGFKNEFKKTIGTFSLFGQYRKTSSFPVEFSMTEKEGRALDFVGKMEGRSLRGTYVVRSNGQEGSWSVGLK